jgi:hypothetical protein
MYSKKPFRLCGSLHRFGHGQIYLDAVYLPFAERGCLKFSQHLFPEPMPERRHVLWKRKMPFNEVHFIISVSTHLARLGLGCLCLGANSIAQRCCLAASASLSAQNGGWRV